ncbi:MAG: DUF2946 family protein [Limnohabitans sp.]|jgi:Protein of unknown function (DUF2946)
MDDIVRQAMAKWPNVPDCYGWLGLDSRGQWHMRDDRVQALGSFQSGVPGAKGSVLRHDKLIEFIHRNYEADVQGRWYFQNGPQRVYVELESTPLIWRIEHDGRVSAHTGRSSSAVHDCLVDEAGHLYLHTALGLGLVHTQDVGLAAELIEQGRWTLAECRSETLPVRFGYVRSPQARPLA